MRVSKSLLLTMVLGFVPGMMAYAAPDSNFIIGGDFVDSSDPIASTTVAIYVIKSQNSGALCTGSIVASDLIVTAAHCMSGNPANMRLIFGTSLKDRVAVLGVANYVRNPNYGHATNNRDDNDIALLQIAGRIPDGYGPATLLNYPQALQSGTPVVLAGYGEARASTSDDIDQSSPNGGSGTLRKTEVLLKDPNYGRSEVLLDQSQGHGACHGDSGGPAFIEHNGQYFLFGVTSRGTAYQGQKDECSGDVVYTNVMAQMPFLRAAAQALRQAAQQQQQQASASQ